MTIIHSFFKRGDGLSALKAKSRAHKRIRTLMAGFLLEKAKIALYKEFGNLGSEW